MAGAAIVPFHDKPKRSTSARVGWVVDENGCHIWQGAHNPSGYGQVRIDGRTHLVHRIRYEREVGPIPEGMVMDHFACDAGPAGCCNPEHVRPVTRRENTLRGNGISAQEAARTHCPEGHPYAGDNLGLESRGHRYCRKCRRDKKRAGRLRRLERPTFFGRAA